MWNFKKLASVDISNKFKVHFLYWIVIRLDRGSNGVKLALQRLVCFIHGMAHQFCKSFIILGHCYYFFLLCKFLYSLGVYFEQVFIYIFFFLSEV